MTSSLERDRNTFEKNVDRAYVDWCRKLDKGCMSVAPKIGELAVVVSIGADRNSQLSPERQRAIFMEEGEGLQETYERQGEYGAVKLYQARDSRDIYGVLQEKEVSGIVLIGHGACGRVMLPGGYLSWEDIARRNKKRSGHLKTGELIQRTCGHIPSSGLDVPLFTFAAADQTNISSPLGQGISDEYPDESLFTQVYDKPHNVPKDIYTVVADAQRR